MWTHIGGRSPLLTFLALEQATLGWHHNGEGKHTHNTWILRSLVRCLYERQTCVSLYDLSEAISTSRRVAAELVQMSHCRQISISKTMKKIRAGAMAPLLFERSQDWFSVPTWWLTVPNDPRPSSVPCRHPAWTWWTHVPTDKPTHKIKVNKI